MHNLNGDFYHASEKKSVENAEIQKFQEDYFKPLKTVYNGLFSWEIYIGVFFSPTNATALSYW